jgi:hypothetical protein
MHGKLAVAAIFIVFVSADLIAQMSVRPEPAKAAQNLTLKDLATAAQHYFRDTAELPMLQTTTFSVTESSGRTSKPKKLTTRYLFHGYNRGRETANATLRGNMSLWAVLRGGKMMKISGNSAAWLMLPGWRLYSEANDYALAANNNSNGDGLIWAKLTPVKPCSSPFTITNEWYFPDHTCGETEFKLDNNLSFRSFAWEAPGLPAAVKLDPLGRCTLRRYHTEVEFQSVTIEGEKEPFLVPRQVTATMETDKGTIVIASVYEMKKAEAK